MIHTLWHSLRPWKVWIGRVILIGLLLIAVQCSPGPQPTATPIGKVNPPEITGFTLIPSGPVSLGAKIGIQVNVKLSGHRIDKYQWVVEEGGGRIVNGQGTSLVTYEAPKTPGFYKVRVELEYKGVIIGDSVIVIVASEPTSTPTDTSTPIPTATPSPDTPTPTSTATPTPTPTDTPTPTNTPTSLPPYPTPALVSPDKGTSFSEGEDVRLAWEERDLAENEFFELRVRLEGEQEFDPVSLTKMSYQFVPASELIQAGTYEWQVAIVLLSGEEKGTSQIWSFEVQ